MTPISRRRQLVIWGASGHALVVADIVRLQDAYQIVGFLDDINPEDSMLFHMGTTIKDGKVVTNGGRVFCITSYGRSIFDAVEISKEEMQKVSFKGMTYRNDIGYEFE